MNETQINQLLAERDRLMDIWRTAEGQDKMAVLTRIEDIDDRLSMTDENPGSRRVLPRRFLRR